MYNETLYDLNYLEDSLESDSIDSIGEAFLRGFIIDQDLLNKENKENNI